MVVLSGTEAGGGGARGKGGRESEHWGEARLDGRKGEEWEMLVNP